MLQFWNHKFDRLVTTPSHSGLSNCIFKRTKLFLTAKEQKTIYNVVAKIYGSVEPGKVMDDVM